MSLISDRDVAALAKAPAKRKVAFKFILIFLAIILIMLGLFFYISWERSQSRDAVRVADIAVIQAAMQQIYYKQGHYDISQYCATGEALVTESCWLLFSDYIPDPNLLLDPQKGNVCSVNNCEAPCVYGLNMNSTDDYEIIFHLEHGIGDYGAGCHYLDRTGMH